MGGRCATGQPPSGPIQSDARLNWNLPSYVNAWNMSLQIAGASLYLPHWSFGAPSASGPLNAFARARTVLGVIPPLPALASLRNRTVVRSSRERDDVPRIRGVLVRLVPLDHGLVGGHALVGRIAVERRGDRVGPLRPVAEGVDHGRVEAERRRHDLARVGDAELLERLRLVRAVGRRAVGGDEVRRRRSDCGQRRGQVGLALRVADLLRLDARRLQPGRDHLSGLRDARRVRVDRPRPSWP